MIARTRPFLTIVPSDLGGTLVWRGGGDAAPLASASGGNAARPKLPRWSPILQFALTEVTHRVVRGLTLAVPQQGRDVAVDGKLQPMAQPKRAEARMLDQLQHQRLARADHEQFGCERGDDERGDNGRRGSPSWPAATEDRTCRIQPALSPRISRGVSPY